MLFRDVIGHAEIKKRLLESLQAGRIAHAQLFIGENGTGALPLALAYAQYVNCENPGPDDSCGQCDACRKTQTLDYPDLHFSFPTIKTEDREALSESYYKEWRAALRENPYLTYNDWLQNMEAGNKQGNITAAEIRSIISRLSLMPMYAGHKIMIIWMPELLGKEGNILLKTLEEPAEKTLILLVAEHEDQILTTILSRTQILRVPRIANPDMMQALTARLGITQEQAAPLIHLAEGNFNRALKYYASGENNFTEEFAQWMRFCYRPDMGGLLKWVDNIAGIGRESQKAFLQYGLHLLRECLLHNQKLDELSHLLETEKSFVLRFAPFIGPLNISEFSESFSTASYYVERNANPKILFFNLSLQVNELLQRYRQRS